MTLHVPPWFAKHEEIPYTPDEKEGWYAVSEVLDWILNDKRIDPSTIEYLNVQKLPDGLPEYMGDYTIEIHVTASNGVKVHINMVNAWNGRTIIDSLDGDGNITAERDVSALIELLDALKGVDPWSILGP